MLFARFLAENNLLIEPRSELSLTMEDMQELALEQGSDWLELAANYAQRMLPEIFRTDDPVLSLAMPPETRLALEQLLKSLPAAMFQADDSLGWVYQFWQTDQREAANRSGNKIGIEELPAVTQLFTEDYMVLFLLHNTLGAWWAGKVLAADPALAIAAQTEDELRAACAVGGVEWTYLRFVREDSAQGAWRPAAGIFESWPKAAKDITLMDPCMGSGHFLVFAFSILVALRSAEEQLTKDQAVTAVLRDNIYGLEIDPRCTQIAAFSLAFAAWRMLKRHAPLPKLHLACSGLAIGMPRQEWLRLGEKAAVTQGLAPAGDLLGREDDIFSSRIRTGLERIYDLFTKAPWLGSLIDPRRAGGDIFAADFNLLEPLLQKALADGNDELTEVAVAAQGMSKAAELLNNRYTIVATNVPYLGRGKAHQNIVDFCDNNFEDAKQDLATVFIRKNFSNIAVGGTQIVVFPQNSLFQAAYIKFREKILRESSIGFLVTLGEEAWQAYGDRGPLATLACLNAIEPTEAAQHFALDATKDTALEDKLRRIEFGQVAFIQQAKQLARPGSRIMLVDDSAFDNNRAVIGYHARARQGLKSGDDDRLVRMFWEVPEHDGWKFMQTTGSSDVLVAGLTKIIRWEDGGAAVARRQGVQAWGQYGIAVSQMRHLPTALYFGDAFDSNVCAISTSDRSAVGALLAFAHSRELANTVRKIEPGKKVNNGTFEVVPFDLAHWKGVAAEKYADALPTPHTSDPTQWLFTGQPKNSDEPLQVAVARLLGYLWPRQVGVSFAESPPLGPDGLEDYVETSGIVCLTPIKGQQGAADRLTALLAVAYGTEWSHSKLMELLASEGARQKTLDEYLRDQFFARHLQTFRDRPFIWHVWDGRADGFHALLNYHKLAGAKGEGRRTLEKLIYTYLGDWIDQQREDQKAGVEGADGRLAAAEHLKSRLEAIVAGEPPFDLFVRWKPLHLQAVGWDPDVNDGVRANIRPFMVARTLEGRKADACILRVTPNITWDKDRGTESSEDRVATDYPWFWSWDGKAADFAGSGVFDGKRWNNLHYTTAAKERARVAKASLKGTTR
ncbi:Eco57I restriction-modification methylase domain-containing protein [Microvirga lotononidis]|nr:DNA methyltransferase [Microvirga lotononidis]WQO27874.1 DNA methyltransferase [Microvirga lotononidis]